MYKSEDDINLKKVKEYIEAKERNISKSQVRENILEKKIRKLEKNANKNVFDIRKMCMNTLYNITTLLIMIIFLNVEINKYTSMNLIQKYIYIIEIYTSIIIISIAGAIIFNKINISLNEQIKRKTNQKINILHKQIQLEKNIQEDLKKEITNIIDNYNIITINNENNFILTNINYKNESHIDMNQEKKEITKYKKRVKKP